MKIAIKTALTFISILFLVLVIMDMGAKNTKETETFASSTNSAFSSVLFDGNGSYEVETDLDLVNEAIQDIINTKESNADIKVQVLGVDAENGMIDLNVIQTIKHVNGKVTQTMDRKTVILEVKEKE